MEKRVTNWRNKKFFLFLVIAFLFSQLGLFAQVPENGGLPSVTGTVVDESGSPLLGATVVVNGTTSACITDAKGHFSVKAGISSVLTVTYVGYKTKEVSVSSYQDLTISLEESARALKEVVVVGYGTLQKKQVTSSISSVSGDDLMAGVGGANIGTALQGKISSLVITGNASPNSGSNFQLRGVASVNAGKTPLIVIDGMPGGDIRQIIQEDILSVDVLKDASAGAIYGTRAAGGVILITTKKAQMNQDGKLRMTYTGEYNIQTVRRRPKVLSADDFLADGRGTDYGSKVDWYNELINKNPYSQKHVFNLNGGNKFTQIYGTFMYNNQNGIAVEDSRTDYAGRFNANFNLLDGWLEIKTHADYRQAKRNSNTPDFKQALFNNPTRSPYDTSSITGYNVWLNESLDYNVLADSKLTTNEGIDKWFMPDATFKLNILPVPGLSVQQSIAYENRQYEHHVFQSRYHRLQLQSNTTGTGSLSFNKTENLSSEGQVSYIHNFNKHAINALAGYSYFEYNNESFGMSNTDFTNDKVKFWDMGEGTFLAEGQASMSSNKSITQRLVSMYSRVNYSYNDKYVFTGTFRREGSSKFAVNNRWGNFWSLSGGWHISQESFLKNIKAISDLKLRIGYGVTGNNNFGADYASTMYGSDVYWLMPSGTWARSYGTTKNINNDLKWEEQHEWNLGLDYAFLDNRLYGKFDIYKRKVVGLIYDVQVSQPPYTKSTMYENIGNMQNTGWEFEIGGDVLKTSKWTYRTSLNLSHNDTKILNLWGNQTYYDYADFPAPGSPGTAIRIQENTKVGSFYMWKFAGLDSNGDFLLYDKDGKAIPASQKTLADKQFVGNFVPKLMLGWSHNVSYKNWDLGVNLRSWIKFDVYNSINMYFGLQNGAAGQNVLKTAYTKFKDVTGQKQLCDYFLEDGTFLKIDAINLAYNLNIKKYTKLFEKARFYVTANNVATFTKYSGQDPEIDVTGLSGGIEWFSGLYPQVRSYTFGVQVTF